MKNVLILDDVLPDPSKGTGSIDLMNKIIYLTNKSYSVQFLPTVQKVSYKTTKKSEFKNLLKLGVKILFRPKAIYFKMFLEKKGFMFDLVIINRYSVARNYFKLCRKYCQNAKIWFHPVALHCLKEEDSAQFVEKGLLRQEHPFKRIKKKFKRYIAKKRELKFCSLSDVTTVGGYFDKKFLKKYGIKSYLLTLAQKRKTTKKKFEARKDIVFIGPMFDHANIHAMVYFVKNIFPKILMYDPKIKLKIVGTCSAREIMDMLKFKNIQITGYIKDIYNVLSYCRVAISPLSIHGGTYGKVCTYLSHGIPSVLNENAAEGMRLKNFNDCLIAKNDDQFVKYILRLYNDKILWNKIRKKGIVTFDKHFSFDVFSSQLDKIFQENFI